MALGEEEAQLVDLAVRETESIEVDGLLDRTVHAPEIDHHSAVDEDPDVVVAPEGEDLVLVGPVDELGVELEGEVEVVIRAVAAGVPVELVVDREEPATLGVELVDVRIEDVGAVGLSDERHVEETRLVVPQVVAEPQAERVVAVDPAGIVPVARAGGVAAARVEEAPADVLPAGVPPLRADLEALAGEDGLAVGIEHLGDVPDVVAEPAVRTSFEVGVPAVPGAFLEVPDHTGQDDGLRGLLQFGGGGGEAQRARGQDRGREARDDGGGVRLHGLSSRRCPSRAEPPESTVRFAHAWASDSLPGFRDAPLLRGGSRSDPGRAGPADRADRADPCLSTNNC